MYFKDTQRLARLQAKDKKDLRPLPSLKVRDQNLFRHFSMPFNILVSSVTESRMFMSRYCLAKLE